MNAEIRNILEENILGTLATVNSDGSPWATPLHIFFDDEALYWFSSELVQHSKNIDSDSRVSAAVFSQDRSKGLAAVYVNGVAQKLDQGGSDEARKIVEARLGAVPQNFVSATAYRLPLGLVDKKKSTGNCWYFYSKKD